MGLSRVSCNMPLRGSRPGNSPGEHVPRIWVVQRFRSDLGLFVHLHCLVTAGCYVGEADAAPRFLWLRAPDDEDLVWVLETVYADLEEQIGEHKEASDEGIVAGVELANSERQLELVRSEGGEPPKAKPSTVAAFGMQLHATTTVDGGDEAALERICRYLLRPAFAQDAVEALDDKC